MALAKWVHNLISFSNTVANAIEILNILERVHKFAVECANSVERMSKWFKLYMLIKTISLVNK